MIKWAMFTKVNGSWRFEGFVEEAALEKARKECEADNGPDSFRACLFVDDKAAVL